MAEHDVIRWQVGTIPISDELIAGMTDRSVDRFLADQLRYSMSQMAAAARLDAQFGRDSHHRPDRTDWWKATRADRVRRNIRRNLRDVVSTRQHHGRFVRASDITLPDPTDAVVFIDPESWWSDGQAYLCDTVASLRAALEQALTCTAIWCMCEAHELLRNTEQAENPYG